jgi:hypothetical protein
MCFFIAKSITFLFYYKERQQWHRHRQLFLWFSIAKRMTNPPCRPLLMVFCCFVGMKKQWQTIALLSSLWGGFARTKKWWQVTQLLLIILVWPCKQKKIDDEQLCCSLSLWCGFAKVKKRWRIAALIIFILVWSYKCEKLTMNNYIVRHCCGIVLQAQGGLWTMILAMV